MFGLLAATLVAAGLRPVCGDPPIRVTVVVVLASTTNTTVDPKLTDLAKKVQKRDPKLTGFRLVTSEGKSIPVGGSSGFELVDGKDLTVKVEKPKDENGRVGLTIKSPDVGSVSYTCVCDKFFPIVTPHKTKTGETLIVVVMAKPCTEKK
jgi:hypothetical protein